MFATLHTKTTIWIRSRHLAISLSQHILVDTAVATLSPPPDKILASTCLMWLWCCTIIIVILSNFLKRESSSLGWHGCRYRGLCSLLNGIFYLNIRYNFVLTIKSSCLLHICSVLQGLVWLKPWPKVLKSGGAVLSANVLKCLVFLSLIHQWWNQL